MDCRFDKHGNVGRITTWMANRPLGDSSQAKNAMNEALLGKGSLKLMVCFWLHVTPELEAWNSIQGFQPHAPELLFLLLEQ